VVELVQVRLQLSRGISNIGEPALGLGELDSDLEGDTEAEGELDMDVDVDITLVDIPYRLLYRHHLYNWLNQKLLLLM